jgi:RNA polymerase sigma-70 factor (ECF subfamily)
MTRNFSQLSASNPMSSYGAEFEADLPPSAAAAGFGRSAESVAAVARELELIRKAKGGDRGAYGRLVVTYQDRLYNAILRIVGDHEEARELAQETFTRGLDKLDGFRGDASPYTWLFRIATNLAISRLRKVQRHRTFSLDAGPLVSQRAEPNSPDQASSLIDRMSGESSSRPDDELEKKERNQKVLEALGRLDVEYRAVLVMRDIEEFDYQQMADVLGLPLGTLKSRLFRARLALRDELRSYMK